jgi:hypothetical protein
MRVLSDGRTTTPFEEIKVRTGIGAFDMRLMHPGIA